MKEIPLTQGLFTQVSDERYEFLNQWKWFAHKRRGVFYAARTQYIGGGRRNPKSITISMHRLILGLTDPKLDGDHRDRNTLNNQDNNLRIATRSENQKNRIGRGKSKYLGVHAHYKRWRGRIKVDGIYIDLKVHDTQEQAARAYDEAAKKYHGEYANLNFK